MAPKRKRRASPAAKGLAPGEQLKRSALLSDPSWSWVGIEASDTSEITADHLLTTCGFSNRNLHPFCPNKYAPKEENVCKEEKSSVVSKGELEDDVIIISDGEGLQCTKKTCKGNPNCLNYLGQDKWEDEDDVQEEFITAAKLGDNPTLDLREPGLPVGLRNLGATCYANASLQVWYRDLAFRDGVYSCQPSKGLEDKFKDSPIFQLQVTFTALQESTQSVFNPTKLVESLQLRTSEQQDAQEFSKLFMSHLDAEFKKQSIPSVRSLVTDQFQGKQVYGTICETCKYQSERDTDFLEIEINFDNHATLENRTAALLQPESLSGDNQYFCSQCNGLQDATRYTEIRELPPVLHFSLLRFVYDFNTMERKKSKHSISFPYTLDMNKFIGSSDHREKPSLAKDENKYQLRGVLLHKGASAYHGHYEAQIYDVVHKSWFQFNDETVTKIKKLGDKVASKFSKGSNEAESDEKRIPQRKNHNNKKRRRVDDSDDDIAIAESPNKLYTKALPEEINTITSKDAYMLIYTRKESNPQPNSSSNGDADIISSVHAPVPPVQALEVIKSMNQKHEKKCEAYEAKEGAIKVLFRDTRSKVRDICNSWNVSSCSTDSVVLSQQALETWLSKHCIESALARFQDNEPMHDKETLTSDTSSGTPALASISNEDVVCNHGQLDPNKARYMKRVAREAYNKIENNTNCVFNPVLQPSDVCRICTETTFRERLYEIEHPRLVKQFDEVSYVDEASHGYWISKKWVRDWRLQKPKMHVFSEGDPAPDFDEYSSDVMCEHGALTLNMTTRRKISGKASELLKEIYPSWNPISSNEEACVICDALIHISKEDKRELRRCAEEEKAKLKRLHDALTFGLDGSQSPFFTVLPTHFLNGWRKWVDNPTVHTRPGKVDNTPFLCEHEMLAFDPNCPTDLDSTLAIIKSEDWDILETLYETGPRITLTRQQEDELMYKHEIPVCEDCRVKRKSDWDSADIVIRLCGPKNSSTEPDLSLHKALITYSRKAGARQSKRLRQIKELGERRRLRVSKSTTVKEIKVMIQDDFVIPTICQRLSYKDTELQDNTATIKSLGIFANDVIDLREENEVVEIDSDSDAEPARKKRREERGFGGTLLGGTVESLPNSGDNTPSTTPQEKACQVCTYDNPYDALTCNICDTHFV
ncbi:hypothetical protein BDQ12DRAFT_644097 [Crucibulum laeve]|uniref:Uncharacterized protein n=1 Tax=Crucibulum laeve TaxID=68775 RepID=A0A5C3MDE7_9AGAR|nr:hypothetical protein BDQ12DRAFT_644097 [Crucibulum laeve]